MKEYCTHSFSKMGWSTFLLQNIAWWSCITNWMRGSFFPLSFLSLETYCSSTDSWVCKISSRILSFEDSKSDVLLIWSISPTSLRSTVLSLYIHLLIHLITVKCLPLSVSFPLLLQEKMRNSEFSTGIQ